MKRFVSILLTLTLVVAGVLYLRPLPKIQAVTTPPQLSKTVPVAIPWPQYGQSAFGAVGFGVLATNGTQKAAPMASIAKVVTAMAVLLRKPLQLNQQGPELTMNSADVAIYKKYVAKDGSVVPVKNGEQISEYQVLQAMLLPSGNNMADSLAVWAFGSQANYLTYANKMVASLGLSQTYLADASGFSPKTVSSARDLVVLGEKALANPVLADIVSQSQAIIPVAGLVNNVNSLVGANGVIGIKTGNTDQAGGCFLFAAGIGIGGQQVKVVGAILGAPDSSSPSQAITDSLPIIGSAANDFQAVQIVKKGQVVGTYTAKWGAGSPAIASQDLSVVAWKGTKPTVVVKLNDISAPATAKQKVGSLSVVAGQKNQSLPIILQQEIQSPSLFWRIFHI